MTYHTMIEKTIDAFGRQDNEEQVEERRFENRRSAIAQSGWQPSGRCGAGVVAEPSAGSGKRSEVNCVKTAFARARQVS